MFGHITDTFSSATLNGRIGQYYDSIYESGVDVSEDIYFQMLALKSAPFIESACFAGAVVASDDQHITAPFSQFAHNLGIAAQIGNDIRSLLDIQSAKSEIGRSKRTLSVAYGLAHAKDAEHELLIKVYTKEISLTPSIEEKVRTILIGSGGIHYSLVTARRYVTKGY